MARLRFVGRNCNCLYWEEGDQQSGRARQRRRAEPKPRWARGGERPGMKLEDRMDTLICAIACAFRCGSAEGERISGICNAMHGFTPRSLDVAQVVSGAYCLKRFR